MRASSLVTRTFMLYPMPSGSCNTDICRVVPAPDCGDMTALSLP